MSVLAFLEKERTVAEPGYSRWMIPPAALAIHLSIGQVYAFSTFNQPLSRVIGVTESAPEDWSITTIGWIFSIAILVLGLAAAFGGRWLERVGPRKAMVLAAVCFSGGFFVSALGVYVHSIILLYLGYGVLGGIGLGIGYISPVSTLIKWFPDRPGLSTGMAIMGFGGGAMIAGPLSEILMGIFSGPDSVGVVGAFLVLGGLYLALMLYGAYLVRIPVEGWEPEGFEAEAQAEEAGEMVTSADVTADTAIKTRQFWLLWAVLFLNVTAGIGVLSQASLMSQEMFPDAITAAAAAGFVGLLSIFNMVGRFGWSTLSDYIGRKSTYMIFFILGAALYALTPWITSVILFVLAYGIVISMYGGGFATMPAYLKDLFGSEQVGAIHGRVLTAWSAAGVAGPVLINYIRDYQLNSGVPAAQAYSVTMYIMAGLLIVGAICNAVLTPVAEKYHMDEEEKAPEQEATGA